MEASVDHMAREASSVRRDPSSSPSRAAWSWLTRSWELSGMLRTTLHPGRASRQSEIPALFGETVYFSGQEGKAGLFHQGHFPAAATDVGEVYVRGDQGLLVERRFRHDRPPGVDDVRVAPEDEVLLLSDPIDEDDVALKHAGVEAGDPTPVTSGVQQFRIGVGSTVGGDYEHLGAVLDCDERKKRLPGVVADQDGHAAEVGVEGAHALSGVVVLSLFVDPVVGQVELAVHVPEYPSFEIRRAVEVLEALPLLAEPHDHGHLSRGLGKGAYSLALCLDSDVVVELFQCIAGEAQLGKDGEVSAPAFRLSYYLNRLAEVLVSVAKDTVDLGQRYPHGYLLSFSLIRPSRT